MVDERTVEDIKNTIPELLNVSTEEIITYIKGAIASLNPQKPTG